MSALGTGALSSFRERGVSVWIDGLSRCAIIDGTIAQAISRYGVVGMSTDICDFTASLKAGAFEQQLAQFARERVPVEDALLWASIDDARRACDLLAPVHRASSVSDGSVSISVDPRWSRDVDALIHDGRRLRAVVGRPNLYVGVPATIEGMSAIQELLCEGISVDATTVYGLEQLRQAVAAVLAGFDQAATRRRDLSKLSAVVSMRVGELDEEISGRLAASENTGLRDAEHTRGDVAVATAAAARDILRQALAGEFWRRLAARGARPPGLVFVTTLADQPTNADTMYPERLAGEGTITAVSLATLRGLADHGKPTDPALLSHGLRDEVRTVVDRVGLDLDAVASMRLERRIQRLMAARNEASTLLSCRLRHRGA